MLFSISGIDVIYCGRFRFDSIRANRPRCDSDPKIVRSLIKYPAVTVLNTVIQCRSLKVLYNELKSSRCVFNTGPATVNNGQPKISE